MSSSSVPCPRHSAPSSFHRSNGDARLRDSAEAIAKLASKQRRVREIGMGRSFPEESLLGRFIRMDTQYRSTREYACRTHWRFRSAYLIRLEWNCESIDTRTETRR